MQKGPDGALRLVVTVKEAALWREFRTLTGTASDEAKNSLGCLEYHITSIVVNIVENACFQCILMAFRSQIAKSRQS